MHAAAPPRCQSEKSKVSDRNKVRVRGQGERRMHRTTRPYQAEIVSHMGRNGFSSFLLNSGGITCDRHVRQRVRLLRRLALWGCPEM